MVRTEKRKDNPFHIPSESSVITVLFCMIFDLEILLWTFIGETDALKVLTDDELRFRLLTNVDFKSVFKLPS